jgi:peroxiredoxin
LRERYDEIRRIGIELLALAPGPLDQAGAFASALTIPFPLLADPHLEVYRTYQVESRLR